MELDEKTRLNAFAIYANVFEFNHCLLAGEGDTFEPVKYIEKCLMQ